MKRSIATFALFVFCCVGQAVAEPVGDDAVAHGIFVAFQEPGIFSEADIAKAKAMLVLAAEEGQGEAVLVVAKLMQAERLAKK